MFTEVQIASMKKTYFHLPYFFLYKILQGKTTHIQKHNMILQAYLSYRYNKVFLFLKMWLNYLLPWASLCWFPIFFPLHLNLIHTLSYIHTTSVHVWMIHIWCIYKKKYISKPKLSTQNIPFTMRYITHYLYADRIPLFFYFISFSFFFLLLFVYLCKQYIDAGIAKKNLVQQKKKQNVLCNGMK